MKQSNWWIKALAVYGVAVALTQKDGPVGIFRKVREKATAEFGEGSDVAAGVGCPVCASFWLAWLVPLLPGRIVSGLALAGAAVVIEKLAQSQKVEIAL